MAPHTVLFDLDSTLCRSTQDAATVHAAAFERAGIEPFCDVPTIREVGPKVGNADSDQDYFRRLFERAAEQVGADPVDADALARATLDVKDDTAVEWRPGAKRALELARERATAGLVTNGSRETQRTKLDVLGIADAFETVVYAGDGPAPKPSPDPFHAALDSLERDSDGALYVGNDYRADVIGAKRAGLGACWVPDTDDLDAPANPAHAPDYTFDSPDGLATLF
jgi:putative hydrolase of the HAD superfamily